MKRVLAVFVAVAVLSIGAIAFAHGGGYGGHMMGYGGGPGMMGYGGGYGNHMGHGGGPGMMGYGPGYGSDKETKEFLEKTTDLRKELHDMRFEYMEAWRAGDEKKAEKLAKELDELSEKLYASAPKGTRGFRGGPCF